MVALSNIRTPAMAGVKFMGTVPYLATSGKECFLAGDCADLLVQCRTWLQVKDRAF